MQDAKTSVAENGNALARARCEHRERVRHARERLQERALGVTYFRRLEKGVAGDDAFWDRNQVGIRPEQHSRHELLAKLLLRAAAPKALAARRGVHAHHRVAGGKALNPVADRSNVAAELVPEPRRHRHLWMAAPIRL